jgi:hypothetical protein
MNPTLDLSGLDRISAGLRRLGDPDCTPLMVAWRRIVEEDNRQGILQGLDKDGVPMAPVTYRPKPPGAGKVGKAANAGFKGFGPLASGLHGNLTSAEYRTLGGPPLAPRGQFSRVITNFQTDHARLREGYWQVTFWWQDVVSNEGISFLRWHFDGAPKLPRRDLRGVRPSGMRKIAEALSSFANDLLRQAFGR